MYRLVRNGAALAFETAADNLYFNGRLIRSGREAVAVDRLGSVRWRRHLDTGATATFDYWPYGQEKPQASLQEREKFGTYYRGATGLDYADQRYYMAVLGNPEPPAPGGGGDAVSAFSTFYLEAILRYYAAGPLFEVPAFHSSDVGGGGVTRRTATETGRAIVEDWLNSLEGSNCTRYFEPYVDEIRKALRRTHFYDVTGEDASRWASRVIERWVINRTFSDRIVSCLPDPRGQARRRNAR